MASHPAGPTAMPRPHPGPADPAAEAVDTTRGTEIVFPALSFALIRLYQGDCAGAEEACAGGTDPVLDAVTGHAHGGLGQAFAVVVGLGRTGDIESLAERF
jgi:hypothetical protein